MASHSAFSRILYQLAILLVALWPMRAQTISSLISVTPCRIIDTRDPAGPLGGPSLVPNGTREIPIPSSQCGIPGNALAYSINVTVVPHGAFEYLTVWPTGRPIPLASTLNAYTGAVTANAAIVPAGTNGSISVFVTGSTDLIIDINGYFAGQQLPAQQAIPTVIAQSTSTTTQNTALGTGASSAGGAQNTALGTNALSGNYSGALNTAVGAGALAAHSVGNENTAVGANALSNSANGSYNTALGSHSLESNGIGSGNTALGYYALFGNTTGQNNIGIGINALQNVSSGTDNIGIGLLAGTNISTGSYNIDIASQGVTGDSGVIRIGTWGSQNSMYVPVVPHSGIGGGIGVVVDTSTGKLGILPSSRRYKESIQDIGPISSDIFALRPVQFRYKKPADDGTKPVQYGLIAEEVEKVYPQLVFRNREGQVEGVQYQQLPALMLNEMQKQQRTIAAQGEMIQKLMLRLEALEAAAPQPQPSADHLK